MTEKFYGFNITTQRLRTPRGTFRIIEGNLEQALSAGLCVHFTHTEYTIICKDNRAVAIKTI